MKLRPCLHGVGDPGLVGKFLLFCVPQSVKTKETKPTRPGSPTPCKQALKDETNFKVDIANVAHSKDSIKFKLQCASHGGM